MLLSLLFVAENLMKYKRKHTPIIGPSWTRYFRQARGGNYDQSIILRISKTLKMCIFLTNRAHSETSYIFIEIYSSISYFHFKMHLFAFFFWCLDSNLRTTESIVQKVSARISKFSCEDSNSGIQANFAVNWKHVYSFQNGKVLFGVFCHWETTNFSHTSYSTCERTRPVKITYDQPCTQALLFFNELNARSCLRRTRETKPLRPSHALLRALYWIK